MIKNDRFYFSLIFSACIAMIAACNHEEEDADNGGNPNARIEEALGEIRQLKAQVALEAGNNGIALRSFQTAAPGDIWIMNSNDNSIQSRSGNISGFVSSNFAPITQSKDMGNLAFSFDWKRSFDQNVDTGLVFTNFALKAAFQKQEVERLSVTLSIVDAAVKQLEQPEAALKDYYESKQVGDNEIKGNIMVSSVVTGRIRMTYNAFDSQGQNVSLDGQTLAGSINDLPGMSAGYAESGDTSGQVNIVQESANAETALAITFWRIETSKQDQAFINEQINSGNAPHDMKESSMNATAYYAGQPVAIFRIRQTRVKAGFFEDVEWFLSIENVDIQKRTLSFSYTMAVYDDLGSYQFSYKGSVINLKPGKQADQGSISKIPLLLRFAKVQNIDIDLH
jgi:hypothetical protein